jgi:hypothetical protein
VVVTAVHSIILLLKEAATVDKVDLSGMPAATVDQVAAMAEICGPVVVPCKVAQPDQVPLVQAQQAKGMLVDLKIPVRQAETVEAAAVVVPVQSVVPQDITEVAAQVVLV